MITSSTKCPLQDGNIQEKQSPLIDSENINHTISSRGAMPTPHRAIKAHKRKQSRKIRTLRQHKQQIAYNRHQQTNSSNITKKHGGQKANTPHTPSKRYNSY
jgi:hypothetical protein